MTDPQPCGITRDYRGTEYPPCTRTASHIEAYCRGKDGTLFLAHPDEPARTAAPEPLTTQQYDRRERYMAALNSADDYALINCRDDRARFADAVMAVADAEIAAALLADNQHLRQQLAAATEFRLVPAPPAYTPLIVRRDRAYDGTRWAVLHDPGDRSVRRAWTADGWEMTWASSHDEIFCWPDAETALAQARLAQASDDREPDVDGAGRTHDSYRDHRAAARPAATTQDDEEPTRLRWGLDDVMYGDDDTTTVMLSDSDGAPYWVELEPERTAALRDALAGPDSETDVPAA